MKKSSHSSKPRKETSSSRAPKGIAPLENPLTDNPADEPSLASEEFVVIGREDEAASSGHRVEPIEADDEHNAEKLIEEGLQGYMHGSLKKPRKTR